MLRSPQLEYPISLPFLPLSHLTAERILAEIERVIQSNREFRLNDSVQVNLIHVQMPNGGTGTKRSEINLEKHLAKKGSIIRIQNKDEMCLNSIIYSGPEKEKRIYLFLHDNHYDVITSMPAFFARKRYCHTCKKGYDDVTEHLCPDSCLLCGFQNCIDCKRIFKSQECFDRHKQNIGHGKSLCALLVKCCHCNYVVKRGQLRPDLHHCGQTKCSTCNRYVDTKYHQCYMQPEKKAQKSHRTSTDDDEEEDIRIPENGYDVSMFLDLECRQGGG